VTGRRVTVGEAHELMTTQGYTYVDVRTVAEFEAGHPQGAYNVPLMIDGPRGRGPNESLVPAVTATFPAKDQKLVVGCLAGPRAMRTAEMLAAAGYTNVVVCAAGWGGAADPFGRVTDPGWKASGLPTATRAEPGRSWAELTAGLGAGR